MAKAPPLSVAPALAPAPRILAIGSAHLDILSTITGDVATLDRPGRTTVEVGGTACNVAINLARLGVDVTLLTSLDDGSLSEVVRRHVADAGVTLRIQPSTSSQRAVASFCAHLDAGGELVSAVSSMPVEAARFSLDRIRGRWDAVFIDANLHQREIERLVHRLEKYPIYLGAVSEQKSLRLAQAAPMADGIFINQREFNYFERHTGHSAASLAAAGCAVFYTRGADGADVITAHGREHVPAARQARSGNRLGAGDALAASIMYHLALGAPPGEAARASMRFAIEVAESMTTNSGEAAPLERAILDFRRQAFVDTLTGIPNRSAGLKRAAELAHDKRVAPMAVAILDIDKFKSINDTYGHDAGDVALKLMARATTASLRHGDFGCRWGGEEFVCLLNASDQEEARRVAERIRLQVQAISEGPCRMTVSIGVASWDPHSSLDEALARADKALYAAKQGGRNRVVLAGEEPPARVVA